MHPVNSENAATTVERDWFASAFDDLYPVVYAHRTVEAATAESAFAIEQLRVCRSCTVLDLCCGNGRHMKHLLQHTPNVLGLDFSPDLLRHARRLLGSEGVLLRGDMRTIPFSGALDAVANFFTSFGYFLDENENRSVAQGIARALKPAGRFFIDYLNPVHVSANLEAETVRNADEFDIVERRWIDESARRVNKTMLVLRDGREISRSSESVRLYGQEELVTLLEEAGLAVEALYGDYDGAPVGDNLPRQIAVGYRP